MTSSDLKALLKRVVEIVMPDLRRYYRVVRKAKVVKTYAAGGVYYADVQPLRNDESDDLNEPVVTHVEIPIIWAGQNRGVACPPVVGAYCDLSYYDGDPDYPRISNLRWHGMGAPAIDVNGFIIQQKPGVHIQIDPEGNISRMTESNIDDVAGENISHSAGQCWGASATRFASITAPVIYLNGDVIVNGSLSVNGGGSFGGSITSSGSIIDATGNTNHHSH
jgi:phage baseplate assembly protein gpV